MRWRDYSKDSRTTVWWCSGCRGVAKVQQVKINQGCGHDPRNCEWCGTRHDFGVKSVRHPKGTLLVVEELVEL